LAGRCDDDDLLAYLLDVFSITIESKWPTKEKVFILFSVPY
jgi:hypothetical protein